MQTDQHANIKALKFNGFKIEVFTDIKGRPCAKLLKLLAAGKNKGEYKRVQGQSFYFANDGRRKLWVETKIAAIKDSVTEKTSIKNARAQAVTGHKFKVGDCLYDSWGYDQTNIDFFEVVEVLPKSVRIKPIGQNMVPGSNTGFMCEYVTPDMGNYTGSAILKLVHAWVPKDAEIYYTVGNGRHSLSLYTKGEKGLYQSHYA